MNIRVEFFPEQSFELMFDLEPETGEWELVADGQGPEDHPWRRYRSPTYTCDILVREFRGHRILSFEVARAGADVEYPERGDRECFTVVRYGLRGFKSFVDTVPYNYQRAVSTVWDYRETSNASTIHKPFLLYGNRQGQNKLAMGFGNVALETEKRFRFTEECERLPPARGRLPTSLDKEEFSMLRPYGGLTFTTDRIQENLFCSTVPAPWFDVESDYFDWLDIESGYEPMPIPRQYLGPVWCSWGFNVAIDEQAIWENAQVAAELGFRNIIIDCGWFHHATTDWFTSPMGSDVLEFGRIRHNQRKFPDLRGLVARIKTELGIGVQLWACPRYLFTPVEEGPNALDPRLLAARIVTATGERRNFLCARNPDARQHGAQLVRHLIEDYDIDGLKFDFWFEWDAGFTCYADHEHDYSTAGEGIVAWVREISEAIGATGNDLLIWFGQQAVKQYGNYWGNNDELYSYIDGLYLSNMATKTENRPVYQTVGADWHVDEQDVNVAKFLAVAQCGMIPEAFTDLTIIRESHKRLVRAWNRFFMDHIDELITGRYTPLAWERNTGGPYSRTLLPVRIQSGKTAFLWVTPVHLRELVLDLGTDVLTVYNIQNEDGIALTVRNLAPGTYRVRVNDIYLEPLSDKLVSVGESLRLDEPVPAGGMAEIVRLDG